MKTINNDYLALYHSSGDANYIGFSLIIKLITWLTLISMGHRLTNLCGYIGWGWVRGLKRTGMRALGFMRIITMSDNNIYRKFIEIMGQNAAPYPTPPKKIGRIAQKPHTGWAYKKMGKLLKRKKANENGYQINFFWVKLHNATKSKMRGIV